MYAVGRIRGIHAKHLQCSAICNPAAPPACLPFALQQPSEQRPHKISYKLHAPSPQRADEVINTLRSKLEAAGLETNVVYSAGVDVDILPSRASKGKALAFLLQQVGGVCLGDAEG